jgi:hypothetical protein
VNPDEISDHLVSPGLKLPELHAAAQDLAEVVNTLLPARQTELDQIMAHGQNQTDPTVAAVNPHELESVHGHVEDALNQCTKAQTHIDSALASLDTTVTATPPSGAYTAPDQTFTTGAADEIVDCLLSLENLEHPPLPASERLCKPSFEEMVYEENPSAEHIDVEAQWHHLASGHMVDANSCIPLAALSELENWNPLEHVEPMPPSHLVSPSGRAMHNRRLWVTAEVQVDWAGLRRSLYTLEPMNHEWHTGSNTAVTLPASSGTYYNSEDTRLLETGCYPWQKTVEEMESDICHAISTGAAKMGAQLHSATETSGALSEEHQASSQQLAAGMSGDCDPALATCSIQSWTRQACKEVANAMAPPNQCFTVPMDANFDCQEFDFDSQLGFLPHNDVDGFQVGDPFTGMSYVGMCEAEKHRQLQAAELVELGTASAQAIAEQTASHRLRRRLSTRISKGMSLSASLRRLLKLPQDVYDQSTGKMLSGIKVDSPSKRVLLVTTDPVSGQPRERNLVGEQPRDDVVGYLATAVAAGQMSLQDVQDFLLEPSLPGELRDMLAVFVEEYEVKLREVQENLNFGHPSPAQMDQYFDAPTQTQLVNFFATLLEGDPVCSGTMVSSTPAYGGNTDGDGDGENDVNEFAMCWEAARPVTGSLLTSLLRRIAQGQTTPRALCVIAPSSQNCNPTEHTQWMDILIQIPEKCFAQCACQSMKALAGGHTCPAGTDYVAGECGPQFAIPGNPTENISTCDVLREFHMDRIIDAENAVVETRRRLDIAERRLAIQDRRRLREEEQVCKEIDGKTFCKAGSVPLSKAERKLQEQREELEAHGISYLIPPRSPPASAKKIKLLRARSGAKKMLRSTFGKRKMAARKRSSRRGNVRK